MDGLLSSSTANLWKKVSFPVCQLCGNDLGKPANDGGDDGNSFISCLNCGFRVCFACISYLQQQHDEPISCLNCNMPYDYLHSKEEETFKVPMEQIEGAVLTDTSQKGSQSTNTVAWQERVESWKSTTAKKTVHNNKDTTDIDERAGEWVLSETLPIAKSKIAPYRAVIVLRLLILAFFLHYRLTNPVDSAYGLWMVSVICEVWFGLSWILDQFPKWKSVNRRTFLDHLSARFEAEDSKIPAVDVFVSTVDPLKEPPLVTANTVLSILSVDYPVDKVSCYISDDGASMLTFDIMSETAEFARKWVPFCKSYGIEPRAPEVFFLQKVDYLKDKVQPSFVKERRMMKREYEEFKVRINALVARSQTPPDEGWSMADGSPWPGNNPRDHPGMIQVFLGQTGTDDVRGKQLPRLVYVSREKRPGYPHHKKAGAINALLRVSAVLSNAPFLLNLDCDHYVNNSQALREAMCFLMDTPENSDVAFVQFPQRFDGIDRSDRYASRNTIFFDINMKGLDGIQGPVSVGTGCVFSRQALYGYGPPPIPSKFKSSPSSLSLSSCCCCLPRKSKQAAVPHPAQQAFDSAVFSLHEIESYDGDQRQLLISQSSFDKSFGQSSVFIESTLMENGGVPAPISPATLIKEAIYLISCGYELKTDWGKEVGWIYGSVTEGLLTGFKMHCRGWRSIYCMPLRPAFKGSAPINLSDRMHRVLRWALGSVEILFSRHCPFWYGFAAGRLKWLERLAYINTIVYPLTSLPLIAYCTLPAICLLTGEFVIPTLSNMASIWFLLLLISTICTSVLELRWSGVSIEDWWRTEQFWVIDGVSAYLFAVFQGLLKVITGIDTNFTVTAKASEDTDFDKVYAFNWTTLLIPPMTLIVLNLVGIVAGFAEALNKGYQSCWPLLGKLFFSLWVILHLYPFLKGLMGRQNRTPTIVVVWSILLASIFSLLWVQLDPVFGNSHTPTLEKCISIDC